MNPFKQKKESRLPEYVLTDRIPASEGERLLGRIVANYRSPTDDYKPTDPRTALAAAEKVLEIIDSEFSSLLSVEKNQTAAAKIGQILQVDLDKLNNEEHELKSSFVRTRTLPQHRDAFEALLKKHADEIVKLIRQSKGIAYMAVGYKSCVNGQMGQARHYANGKRLQFEIPTNTIVTAATHGVVNLDDQLNVSGKLGSQEMKDTSTSATMVGEQIFAVRYRILTLKKGENFEDKNFGDVLRVEFENGVFGYSGGKFITEDDTSDDDEVQTTNENESEEIVIGGELTDEVDIFIV